jgi:NTE family protein
MRLAEAPEALVLGGGGILGLAWMSAVLAGLDESGSFDARDCGSYIGTSAGSIVAASLVAGVSPATGLGRLAERPAIRLEESVDGGTPLRQAFDAIADRGGSAVAPLASLAFSSTAGGGALLRRAALRRVPEGKRSLDELGRMISRTGASWDGRLRVAAVELESGRRVMFGSPGAPDLSVSEAVQASCAIPGVFRPIRSGGSTYVDGGAWSPTNMDTADVVKGDRVLCLNPTGSMRPSIGALAGAFGPVSRGLATAEALVLKHRGAVVTTINPDEATTEVMGPNLMNPKLREAVIEAGLEQGRRLAARDSRQAA